MAKKRARGGYRQPKNPAAVSGPGFSSSQPIRRIPGVAYGEQKALSAQQSAAPLPVANQGQTPVRSTQGAAPNVFAATEFPNQPITEGAMLGAGSPPMQAIDEDANMLLAAMYQVMPNSIISELINQGSE